MKRHAMFVATALAVASIGTASAAHAGPGKGYHGPRGGIERLDADGDGRISRAEFEAAAAAREARIAESGKPADAVRQPRHGRLDFDAVDANGDGYLVRQELRAYREREGARRSAERDRRMAESFAATDLNRDGRLSRVEVDEKMPRLAGKFAWMDDDRDGFLSREEFGSGRSR